MNTSTTQLAVITGGSKGIGKSVVEIFAKAGFHVVTCARNMDSLNQLADEVAKKYSSTISVYQADLSQRFQVTGFIDFVLSLQMPIGVLVNNTGVFKPGQIQNEEEGVFDLLMSTNLASAYHITRGFLPEMLAQNSGHIFNICSVASITPYTNGGSYCISKFALLGMGKVLREELKQTGIRVTNVLPGATLTDSWAGADLPKERFIDPDDVAKVIFNAWQLSPSAVVEELVIRPQLGDI